MIETGGFVILAAWLIFAALLATLSFFLLRPTRGPDEEADVRPEDPPTVP